MDVELQLTCDQPREHEVTPGALDSLYTLKTPKTPKVGHGESTQSLRIFMPADNPHINLCKTIMSAVALGYPIPTLLNWDGEFNRPEWQFSGSHIAKLESLHAVIDDMLETESAKEDDIAFLVDAYDIWFQLPPAVLIERFHQLNNEANQRIKQQWKTDDNFPVEPPRQSVIITTAKDCFPTPDSGSDPHYAYWPQSPMPADMYGPETDQLVPPMLDSARKYRKVRPRCVNSGLIMGTMGGLRDALARASEKVEIVARSGRQLWSDQALIAEVIGEQEIYRQWMMQLGQEWNGTASNLALNSLRPGMRRVAQDALTGKRFEFGIGLDYNFATIPPTCSAEEDGYFVNVGDEDSIKAESTKAGVPGAIRVKGVPPELEKQKKNLGVLSNVLWANKSLYTDFFFGITPVGIHHNAYVENLKPRRLKEWWSKMWFHDTLRELVTNQLSSSTDQQPTLATVQVDKTKITYKRPVSVDKLVTVFKPGNGKAHGTLKPLQWDNVCQKGSVPWEEQLFNDNKGRFKL